MKNISVKILISFILFLLLFLGGFGNFYIIEIAGLFTSLILSLTQYFSTKDFRLPKQTGLFIIFIACQLISLMWSKNIYNSIEYIVLFISSFGFWIYFYNTNSYYKKYLIKIVPTLGFLFFVAFFFTEIVKVPLLIKMIPKNTCTLYSPYTSEHNHLGDFWAITTLILAISFLKKQKKTIYLLGISFGLFILVFSQSRSALLGIFTALYVYFTKNNLLKEKRGHFIIVVIFFVLLFLITSAGKVTIFSRPYFLQAIISLFRYPFGVGMGNFRFLSSNLSIYNLTTQSAAKAHNIFFEITSGLGILSIPFFVFFISTYKDALKKKNSNLSLLIFILLTVNFSFDVTYAVPTMLWLWFSTLGISQSVQKNT